MQGSNKNNKIFATTFLEGLSDPRFASSVDVIPVPPRLDLLPRKPFRLRDEISLFVNVLIAGMKNKGLLLFSSRGHLKPELSAIILFGFMPKKIRPKIVVYGEMFEPNAGLRHVVERIVMKLVDRGTELFAVYSFAEIRVFEDTWGIPSNKIRVNPFFRLTSASESPEDDQIKPRGSHLFAGGNSMRDYEMLVRAAGKIPEEEIIVCTKMLDGREDIPPNIKISWPRLELYNEYLDTAAAVIIPLQVNLKRTAGLLTIMDAMYARRLIIVPDATGISELISHQETGLIVANNPESYVEAIQWALDPSNAEKADQICEEAHNVVLSKCTLESHISRLLNIMDEAISAD